MAVYYKFKSAKDYDSIPIEGQFISVANLKERIFESKRSGGGTDFDLLISNAQTDEEYHDDAAMIPKSTSLLIRRVPGRPRIPIVSEKEESKDADNKSDDLTPTNGLLDGDLSTLKFPEEHYCDEFGNDLYAIPEVHSMKSLNPTVNFVPGNKLDEDSKIKALIDTPALDWNRLSQDSYGSGRGFGWGGARMMAGHGYGRGFLENRMPPAGYVCYRCKISGHFIQHCPTNGDPNYDIKRIRPPTGIPRSMLMATPDGSYALPSGSVAVLKPNECVFEKEIEGLPSTRLVSDLPPELRCQLCKEVMKDAVLTSKCCFSSFCDKCIRDYVISKSMCVCGATNILADDLLPNKTLRETINRIMETTTSSTENAGSIVLIQDVESARPMPRPPSPTLSATSKDEAKRFPVVDSEVLKAAEDLSEAKNVELIPQEGLPFPEDAQEKQLGSEQAKKKKKKKTRLPVTAGDMQWRTFQDLGAEHFVGMPLQPSAYHPFWPAGGIPMGMDPYMGSFNAAVPFMGYPPGPFDVPYGGMIPTQGLVGAQGCCVMPMPFGQRDRTERGMTGINMNHGPRNLEGVVLDAKKPELLKKQEFGKSLERENYTREKGGSIGRGGAPVHAAQQTSSKSKPVCCFIICCFVFMWYVIVGRRLHRRLGRCR